MATYTGLDGLTGTAFTIVAGGFTITAGGLTLTDGTLDLGQTYVPSSNRDDIGLSIGTRAAELDVDLANSTSQHLEPVQMNLNFTASGGAPTSTSTVNVLFMKLTHDTIAMPNLRLKGCDWTMAVGVNIQDAYMFQGEIDLSGSFTVGGEVAVIGLTLNSGTGSITGNIWGMIIVTTGTAGQDAALFLSHRGGTLVHSVYIEANSSQTITDAIYLNPAGNITNVLHLLTTTNITFFLKVGTAGGAVVFNASFSGQSAAEPDASIAVDIAGNTLYLYAYPVVVS